MKLRNLKKAYELKPDLPRGVKILMDTRGPEIRTGYFHTYNSKKELKAGQEFTLYCGDYSYKGDENGVAITYPHLPRDAKPGQAILIQDGTVSLTVKEVGTDWVKCTVNNNGRLGEKKNVNIPGF